MMRVLLAGTTAAALLAGGALAQSDTSTTKSGAMPSAAATESVTPAADGKPAGDLKAGDMKAGNAGTGEMPTRENADAGASGTVTTMSSAAPAGGFIATQAGTDTLASSMLGRAVVNPQDEKVGDIDDLVMDRSGRVTAAVIGVGGFLGIGEKSVGVPIEALEPRQDEDGEIQLVTMLSREELEQAPEFVDLETKMQRDAAAAQESQREELMKEQQAPAGGTARPAQ